MPLTLFEAKFVLLLNLLPKFWKLSKIRIKPKIPNFTIKPLSKMENSTEASTWAFNNQERQGQTGILTPNPIKKKKLKIFDKELAFGK